MKKLISCSMLAAFIGAAAVPVFAQTQSAAEVTRAQTRADLAALERVGYYPAYGHGPDYPLDLQTAERKVAAQKDEEAQYGSSAGGTSAVGSR
ncbi:DUF4148 domain-containing protein [Caballeronia sordidicola]|uniref:DUF4148 domain-containing protein n=1 Tax=Caballeronia sordidicola TaxID=196367 RepID=UPI0004CFF9F9|nr:DUF4148 domain-containing protein [Caballeronia sordidicola]